MSSGLADNVRKFRRAAGLSQEGLAHESGLGDEANRRYLVELRKALMPPVGLAAPLTDPGEAGDLTVLRREIADSDALYQADRYGSVAKRLPRLLRSTEATVAVAEAEERQQAVIVRAHALLLAGKYLTQVRQYDMAYYALAEGIRLARETGQTLTTATGVVGMCWLLLRQDRFDESEHLAAVTAAEMEPRISQASPGHLAVWGELWLRVASSTVRNNRPQEAREARRMAGTAASALGKQFCVFGQNWGNFGPVTAELKVVEDLSIADDARGVLRRADDGLLSTKAISAYGNPGVNSWGRHRLDVAKAHVTLGSHQDAMSELDQLRRNSGEWLTHQPMARYVMSDLLASRKRTLTQDMREMAAHLGIKH
ncbi:transcriptional regulator [Streptomyces sp. NPDC053079]|uniref:transcriptional regulator n=1 Tax=Streptomyces sp. NPDC053079 TaxID=3365697 RepID=UPI0037D2D303